MMTSTTSTLPSAAPLPEATEFLSLEDVIAYVDYCLAGVYVDMQPLAEPRNEEECPITHMGSYRPMPPYGITGSLFAEWDAL